MKAVEKYLFSFYGAALIILSFTMVVMLFGSGHKLNLHEVAQMKLAGEIFVFLLTATALLSKKRNYIFGRKGLIVLVLLSATALIDIFIELKNGEAENQILVFIMLAVMMIGNLWILAILIKKLNNYTQ